MYRKLDNATLKSGEPVELGLVTGPDGEWGPRISHLLGHKGEPWNWQIGQCLGNPALGMETRCFILSRDGRPFANICTFEAGGVGLFGHVYTVPEDRRKGAADLLNEAVMGDFKARGGRALYLGTKFDSPAYHIYRRHGFQSVESGSGDMVYARAGKAAFEAEYFAPGVAVVETLAFHHWPVLPALTMMDHPARLRVLSMGIVQASSTEHGVLEVLKTAQDVDQPPRALVAVSQATHAPAAFACVGPDRQFGSAVDLLDVFWAPGFEAEAVRLIDGLKLAAGRKTICFADSAWPQKAGTLETAGFAKEATLKKHLASGGQVLDVTLWSKGI